MIGVNKVILVGRAASDVECRTTKSGRNLTRFTVAIPRRVDGEQDTADFFDVTTWNRTAEICGRYVKKGEKLYIEGRLTKSVWENGGGEKRSRIEVTANLVNFLGSPVTTVEVEEQAEIDSPEA